MVRACEERGSGRASNWGADISWQWSGHRAIDDPRKIREAGNTHKFRENARTRQRLGRAAGRGGGRVCKRTLAGTTLLIGNCISLTYRKLFHNLSFTYRNYRRTRTKVCASRNYCSNLVTTDLLIELYPMVPSLPII